MKTRKIILLRCAIVFVLGVGWLFSGGLSIETGTRYFSQLVKVEATPPLDIQIWIKHTQKTFDIPFMFHYCRFKKPLDVRITIIDPNFAIKSLEIQQFSVEYDNGEYDTFKMQWMRQFKTESYQRATDEGLIRLEKWQIDDNFCNIVDISPRGSNLIFNGILIAKNGQKLPFKVSARVIIEKNLRITTLREFYAGC